MKCDYCKKLINSQPVVVYSGKEKRFCSISCYRNFLLGEKEKEDRNFLYKEICRIFNITTVTDKLFAQAKRLKENEGLSYRNIANILHYIYDIEKKPVYSPTLYYVAENKDVAQRYFAKLKDKEVKAIGLIEKDKKRSSSVVKPNYKTNRRKSGLKVNPEDV